MEHTVQTGRLRGGRKEGRRRKKGMGRGRDGGTELKGVLRAQV